MKFDILPHTWYGILWFSRLCTEMLLNGSAYRRGKVRGTSGDTRTGEGKFKIVGSWNVWIFGLGKAIYLSFRFGLVFVPGLLAGGLFGHGLFVSNYFLHLPIWLQAFWFWPEVEYLGQQFPH